MRISETIHADLRGRILSGELAPGDPVPSERELAESLGVNRHAVREALKRLEQARLVLLSQGGATRVLDWRATGGLDLLLDLALGAADEPLDPALVDAIVELRASIGVDAARRCAQRGSPELRARAAALALELAETDAIPARRAANSALWDLIVDGAGNIAYRLALNSLAQGLEGMPALADELTPGPGDRDELLALSAALLAGDGDRAHAAAAPILERPLRNTGS